MRRWFGWSIACISTNTSRACCRHERSTTTPMTKRIDGKSRADRLVADVAAVTAKLKAQSGIVPGLCAVLVGEDPASQVYVRNKGKAAVAAGIASFQETLPATITEAELLALIGRLNADERVDGILVQLPLPKHIDPQR